MKRLICIILWVLLIILLLTGCSSNPVTIPPPALAQCNSMCYTPCVTKEGDTGIVWEATGTKAEDWDLLAGSVVIDLIRSLKQCDKGREACTKCLDRLEQQGIIKQ